MGPADKTEGEIKNLISDHDKCNEICYTSYDDGVV